MKKLYLHTFILGCLIALSLLNSCTPETDRLTEDIHVMDASQITRVILKPENLFLIADGKATMTCTPIVYYRYNNQEYKMPQERVNDNWFEFVVSAGKMDGKTFSTTDKNLIGKQIKVKAKVKSSNIESNDCIFTVTAPSEPMKELIIPIVFHLLRNEGEETIVGYTFTNEMIMNVLDKLNKIFAGKASNNSVGTDTYIRFKPAVYDPTGNKLPCPGINRIMAPANSIDANSDPLELIEKYKMNWDCKKYMNVWLISVSKEAPIYTAITEAFKPYFRDFASEQPEGFELTPLPPGVEIPFPVPATGIIYRAENLNDPNRSYSNMGMPGYNEIYYYIGQYFGLRGNNSFNQSEAPDNYCHDTPVYGISSQYTGSNKTCFKETDDYFFISYNIMDDPTGFHTSISPEQAKRMRWVIENCPERSAFKSSYAFTGINN